MQQVRRAHSGVRFLLVGTGPREVEPLRLFFERHGLSDAILITGAVPHDEFLTMLKESLAYVRMPMTDGVCSSVLEALSLGIPVLASDNGARPRGAELWPSGKAEDLAALMEGILGNRARFLRRIPAIASEDNVKRLADSMEAVCRGTHQP